MGKTLKCEVKCKYHKFLPLLRKITFFIFYKLYLIFYIVYHNLMVKLYIKIYTFKIEINRPKVSQPASINKNLISKPDQSAKC